MSLSEGSWRAWIARDVTELDEVRGPAMLQSNIILMALAPWQVIHPSARHCSKLAFPMYKSTFQPL